ncbi:zinc-dependent alcohol dehydrogenase [Nitrolancea hollandica]|uniref:Putative Sorbitol dehydrogenase n=1 Tax=Nitrolancea hollandica Lb TaxID=1129897 RepID=I4EDF5_9BACT|nr:zinc-binding dehydrogenase [Nitrolancea hollandica]CCF82717.1 putative Sorbitol dehydrogenase [Nitrolancea hollandica Lb]
MQALQFTDSIPRYVLSKLIGTGYPAIFWSDLACLRLAEISPPPLPTPEWLRIDTRYGGICGSDLGLILLHSSPSSSPFTSFPFTLGHENVGVVAETGAAVQGISVGQRVVVNPLLACAARGFNDPCEMCAQGETNLCQRFREGAIAPGMLIGVCCDTGGSWSPSFVAHQSQIIPVPDNVSDEAAVLAEPFAVALHAVLRNRPSDDQTVLIVGAGVIGLLTLAAIRAIGSRARVLITARHPFQVAMAERLGADLIIRPRRGTGLYHQVAEATGARVLKPVIGKQIVLGGIDIVYECVGSPSTVDDSLRLTSSGGTMVLVGLAASPRGVDWTPIWLNEVRVHGSFCYADEEFEGERIPTLALALKLMAEGRVDLAPLLTHRFELADYRRALETVTSKGKSGVIKAVFAFDSR